MKLLAGAAFVVLIVTTPVWAGESGGFDPGQPFKGLSQRLLESFLGPALDALDNHFEISGSLDPDSPQGGDGTKKLRFKFYPEGKSKSDDHIAAEGWLGPSKDSDQQEFHFRFAMPKSPAKPGPSFELPDNVL